MGPSILRLICRKAVAVNSRRGYFGGGGRRMMTTATTVDPSRISPWLMLPPSEDGGGGGAAYKFYSLASNKVMSFNKEPPPPPSAEGLMKLVGSSHGWLASFNVDNRHIFLSDPIFNRHVMLPDIHTLPKWFVGPRRRPIVDKIILTCSPAAAADECRAVMAFGVRRMALCCPDSDKWTLLGDEFYKDFVYSSRRKHLFCFAEHGRWSAVERWDLSDPDSPTKDWHLDLDLVQGESTKSDEEAKRKLPDTVFCRSVKYLVFAEESDQLFLVTRRVLEEIGRDGTAAIGLSGPDGYCGDSLPYKTFAFDVHEIDSKGRNVRYVVPEDGCLNGLAMFVGNNHSFALSAATDFPELKPDSIYFTEDEAFTPLEDTIYNYGGHDIGIYNYAGRNFSPVYYSCRASDITWILPPPIWFIPPPYK